MKHILLFLSVIQVQFVLANKTDSLRSNENNTTESYINNYKKEAINIYQQYQALELQTLDSEYQRFKLEVNKSEPDLNLIKRFMNKLEFYHSLKQEESTNIEITSTKYFNLSAKVFQYKNRVQNLFINEKSGSFYGGMANQKQAVIQKKRLFEAGMLVFDTNMQLVKNTNPCDPATRIEYLSDNMKMLIKMEKLLMADNTRELEKSLKNLEDTEKIKELIYGYQIN